MKFRFVDAISRIKKNEYMKGLKTVSFEEGFIKRPYSRNGFLPRTLLMETLAQLASWLIVYSTDFESKPLMACVDKMEIFADARTGDLIEIDCGLINLTGDGAHFNVRGSVGGREIIKADSCVAGLVRLETLENVNDARAMFARLSAKAVYL
ncbi:MAG: (3R)-hydroxymyristoyl-ACP dehydratase [bacterium ADurb.Bin243]|nr:MAG: (3R)-hydroxymyristoyl-ACP dehydratase [bacterium ADurb.Bin243]